MNENEIGAVVVDCAVRLHIALGPGLLETVYEVVLAHQLQKAGLKVERQVPIPIKFQGIHFSEGFRADIIVENSVILELKSVENVTKAHKKQVLTYLRLTDIKARIPSEFWCGDNERGNLPHYQWGYYVNNFFIFISYVS